MIPKEFERFTNYNVYLVGKKDAHKVSETALRDVINRLLESYKRPYVRFMYASNVDCAHCVVYTDNVKGLKATKLVPFIDVVTMLDKNEL